MVELLQIVDSEGVTVGEMEKLAAHRDGGTLHRAISVFLLDDTGRLLIQRRAAAKYHFAGLWANTCCSHPLRDETPAEAARRAVQFELGIEPAIEEVGVIIYSAHDAVSGLTEREYDHIFVGVWNDTLAPNPAEVKGVHWVSSFELRQELEAHPERFAPWLPVIVRSIREQLKDQESAFGKFLAELG